LNRDLKRRILGEEKNTKTRGYSPKKKKGRSKTEKGTFLFVKSREVKNDRSLEKIFSPARRIIPKGSRKTRTVLTPQHPTSPGTQGCTSVKKKRKGPKRFLIPGETAATSQW